jgi:putative transposase
MGEYRHSAHAVFDLKYHLIWCTKYRYKILRGRVAERARDLIRQICQARDVVIVRGVLSPDHVHMLLSAPPHLAPAKLAQYITGRSSRRLQEEFPDLRQRYWGQHLWARGYFCATVGAVDEATIQSLHREPEVGRRRARLQDHRAHRALSRRSAGAGFRRLQPHLDFQSRRILPALSR